MRGEARLRGRERIICSKTISPPEALSYRLSSIGYSSAPQQALLSVIGYRLSAIGYRLSAIGYRLSAIGYRLSAIGYRLSAIGYRLSAIGYRAMPFR
jgi:hypothetical protein